MTIQQPDPSSEPTPVYDEVKQEHGSREVAPGVIASPTAADMENAGLDPELASSSNAAHPVDENPEDHIGDEQADPWGDKTPDLEQPATPQQPENSQ